MTNDYGLVSIITPTWACAGFIAETIRSIQAQTYTNWELLIQDDCSTDNTREVVERFAQGDNRIKYECNDRNSGAAITRNNALKRAQGRWIAFLDSDDLWLPEKLWSELFHLGYFSYYPLIFLTILEPWATNRKAFERTAFIVLGAFFLYYLIYLFLPVAGPQYYFQAVGFDRIEEGVFPALGDYFRTHSDLAPSPGPEGFFRGLVESTQASGERPTAAFPSSHVGVSTVLMLLLWTNRRCLFFLSLPFYILLCAATVYIQAHYLIDVFGGWLTAVAFYFLFQWTYNRFFRADNPFTGTEPVEE